MSAPLLAGEPASLVAAVVIGIAFGAALERAGLGSARKLTAQFRLTDLTVFKVMFTAILVAMLGTFFLAWLGLLDLSRVSIPKTSVLLQLAGGLIFGIGFAVAGLCPGTSCVAAASGRGDGAMTMLGMFGGVLAGGLAYDPIVALLNATPRGALTLPQAFGVPYGVVVGAVTLIALAGFFGAEWIEKRRL